MKNKYNKLTCLFGHHDYGDDALTDKSGLHFCKVCKKSAFRRWNDGAEVIFACDEEGNLVHATFDGKREYWLNDSGNWVGKKPKNWEER